MGCGCLVLILSALLSLAIVWWIGSYLVRALS